MYLYVFIYLYLFVSVIQMSLKEAIICDESPPVYSQWSEENKCNCVCNCDGVTCDINCLNCCQIVGNFL